MRPPIQDKFFLRPIVYCHSNLQSREKNLGSFSESLVRQQSQKRLAKSVLSKVEGLNTTAPFRDA